MKEVNHNGGDFVMQVSIEAGNHSNMEAYPSIDKLWSLYSLSIHLSPGSGIQGTSPLPIRS